MRDLISRIAAKPQMDLSMLMLLLFVPWLLHTSLEICGTNSFETGLCAEFHIKVQQKLLQEPKLTLNRCIDIARSAESTTAQLNVITGQTEDSSYEVHAAGKWQRNKSLWPQEKCPF